MIDLPALDHVMLATDLGIGREQTFAHGLRLALAARGRLSLLHVKAPKAKTDWRALPSVKELLTQWGWLSEETADDDYEALGLEVRAFTEEALDPLPALVRAALAHRPDLLIFGTESRTGLEQLASYSVSEHVARASGIPALFLSYGHRGFVDLVTGDTRLSRILVPVGGDMPLQQAVGWTAQLLDLLGVEKAEITLLHVGEKWEGELEVPARSDWRWEPLARHGLVVPVVVETARRLTPDLVVMATQGGTGALRGFIGSNTERVLHQVSCPVLAVPV